MADVSTIILMAAPRGRAHRGRTGAFDPDKPVKASALLHTGDPVRAVYEQLIAEMGISGSEVIRQALLTLHQRRAAQAAPPSLETYLQEAG